MAHGSGGKAMRDLIEDVFLGAFDNPDLNALEDQARFDIAALAADGGQLAFTTDSYVVDPIFFPGGNIGTLAVNGTVNDLAVSGAIPKYLSCGMIIEEGMPVLELREVVQSMREAADAAGVTIVTGDTKVVPRGKGDKLFINTTGIGVIPNGINISAGRCQPGDKVIVNGFVGDHGAAILNAQPMGFYAPSQLVRDAREHGVEIRPVDINASDWDSTLEDRDPDEADTARRMMRRHREMENVIETQKAVRLGFRQVKGLREDDMVQLVERRGRGYDSVRDLWLRSGLKRAQIERLADADAFRSIGLDRRAALWAVRALDDHAAEERLPLFERMSQRADPDEAGIEIAGEAEIRLPPMPPGEQVVHDYRYVSLSLKAHPVSFLRRQLDRLGVMRHESLDRIASGRRADVAGLVLVRQRPGSAKGVIFMTLEDETGVANVIVWPKTFERYRSLVLGSRLVRVSGRLQNEMGVIHVVADRIEDLTPLLGELEKDETCDMDLGDAGLANADEVRRPVIEIREKLKPRSRLAQLLKEAPQLRSDYDRLKRSEASARAMPRGRNFH